MLFDRRTRVRLTGGYEEISNGTEGLVACLDLDVQRYSVTLVASAQSDSGMHEISLRLPRSGRN